jgi:hypothetical protein
MSGPIRFTPNLPQIIRTTVEKLTQPITQAVTNATQNTARAVQSGFEQQVKPLVDLTGGVVNTLREALARLPSNPGGKMHQQFPYSCGPNTIMAMEASVDANRAQELRDTPAADRDNREVAVMNSGAGGFRPDDASQGGWSSWEMQSQIRDRFGAAQALPADGRYDSNASAAADLEASLREGRPVAMGMNDHWMAATEIRDGENGAEVLIHDSWTGNSAWVPVSEIADPTSGWSSRYLPGAPGGDAIVSVVVAGTPGQPAALNPNSANIAKERETLSTVSTDFTHRSDTHAPAAAE